MQTTAMIKEVTKKNIEPKSGAAPFTLFEIEDSNGTKWTTKKDKLALEAHSLIGKMTQIEGTIKENGQFTNYYLEGLTEATGIPETFSQNNGNAESSPVVIPNTTGSRDETIWRQTATKVAAQLADTPTDFWLNVDLLLNYYRTGVHPGQQENDYATASTFTGDADSDIPF